MIEFQFKKVYSKRFGEVLKPIIPVTIMGAKEVQVFPCFLIQVLICR
jgi:hypothetical protein